MLSIKVDFIVQLVSTYSIVLFDSNYCILYAIPAVLTTHACPLPVQLTEGTTINDNKEIISFSPKAFSGNNGCYMTG